MNSLANYYLRTGVFVRTESAGTDEGTGSLTVGHISSGIWLAAPFARGERATAAQIRNPFRRRLELDWISCGVYARTVKFGQRLEDHYLAKGVWAVKPGRSPLSGTLDLLWAVRQAVSGTLSSQWRVYQAVSGSLSSFWTVYQAVGGTQPASWAVRQSVAGNNASAWSVREAIAGNLLSLWGVRRGLTNGLSSSWAVRAAVDGNLPMLWAVRKSVAGDVESLWSVRVGVDGTLSSSWKVEFNPPISGEGDGRSYGFGQNGSTEAQGSGFNALATGATKQTTATKT